MALTVKAAELSKELTRVLTNVSKRNTRLKQKDVKGANLVTERTDALIAEIRSMPRSNYGEIKSALAVARRLDKAAGTRDRSFQRAAKRAYNDDLLAQASNPYNISRMTKDQLTEVYAIQRSRLRDKVRRVKEGTGGGNFMTKRADKLLAEDSKGASSNKLRSLVSRAAKDLAADTLTVSGAKKQFETGDRLFGEAYKEMNDEQRTAVWEAMHRQMEYLGLSSERTSKIINGVLSDQQFRAEFLSSPTGELQAVIGQGLNSAKANALKAQAENEAAMEIIEKSFAKHGRKKPDFLRVKKATGEGEPIPYSIVDEETVELPL